MSISSFRALALAVPLSLALMSASAAIAQTSFVDQAGRTVTLDAPPKRLVTLPSAAPVVYFAVDGTIDHIAGTASTSLKTFEGGLYSETIPELLKLDATMAGPGFATNVEAVLAAKPDLVFEVVHKEGQIEQLEAVGLKVAGWSCCTACTRRCRRRL